METLTQNKITIAIAEPRQKFRNLLASRIDRKKNLQLVGVAATSTELLASLKRQEPDVALINPEMIALKGLNGLRRITVKYPRMKCILLHEEYLSFLKPQFKLAGAYSFLRANTGSNIFEIIRTINSNEIFKSNPALSSNIEILSGREREILRLICRKKGIAHIARILKMDVASAELHKMSLCNKVNTNTYKNLMRLAMWLETK